MSEKPTRKAPKQVRLYPEIEEAWEQSGHSNFNWWVNYLFAEKFGIPFTVVDKYRRSKAGEEEE